MAEKSFPLENTMYTAADAQLWFATRTSGVYAGTHLPVTAAGTMNVTVGSGIAWLHYDPFAGCVYANTDNLILSLEMSDGGYDRFDRVCIRLEKLNNRCYLYIKKGVPSSTPVPPALQRDNLAYEISIAKIFVGVGVVAINAGNITDERLDSNVCGLMRDGVTGIDTTVISAQVTALINELQGTLQTVYNGVEKVNIIEKTATLLASGWSTDEPYRQTVVVDGVLGADRPFVDVDMDMVFSLDKMNELLNAWAGVVKATANTNDVTVYMQVLPEVDIPIKVKVVR
jgi:hypothetical protein